MINTNFKRTFPFPKLAIIIIIFLISATVTFCNRQVTLHTAAEPAVRSAVKSLMS